MSRSFLLKKSQELRENMTNVEKMLWAKLRRNGLGARFYRQHIFDNKYIVDFYCAEYRLIIELDGGQHCENADDKIRDEYFDKRGYKILRFWNNEVVDNFDGVLQVILDNLDIRIN